MLALRSLHHLHSHSTPPSRSINHGWIVNDSAQPSISVEENYVEKKRKKKRKILLRVENFPSSILCDALQNVYALAEHTETTRITAHCIIPNPRLQREHEARISARTTYSSDVTSPLSVAPSSPSPPNVYYSYITRV